MRVPLSFVLYVVATTLISWVAYTIYDSSDCWRADCLTAATKKGRDDALGLLTRGKSNIQTKRTWDYGASLWWQQFLDINLIAHVAKVEAPAPDDPAGGHHDAEQLTPLEDLFELVVCCHDRNNIDQEKSHVILRYKPAANVTPPQWWLDENQAIATDQNTSRNLLAAVQLHDRRGHPAGRGVSAVAAPINGQQLLQSLWLNGSGDPRRAPRLWGQHATIRLLRVDASGESAWFVRDVPAHKGKPATTVQVEQVWKTSARIPPDVLRAARSLQGRDGQTTTIPNPAEERSWLDVAETTRIGNEWHIGRNDEQRLGNFDSLLNDVHLDTYVSRVSGTRGLEVRHIQPQLAKNYGIQIHDVLLEVNGHKVASKAQAANRIKTDYERGVRTFSSRWWSDGQAVERVYHARDQQ